MAGDSYLFTSESVTEGHPDKVSDQISDGVLDAVLAEDPQGRVACETLVTTGVVVLAGEITCRGWVDFGRVARATLRRIGYTRAEYGIAADTCAVFNAIDPQSPDIAQGVDTGGAGDQGLMFGYACRETEQLMPLPITLAHALTHRLAVLRHGGDVPWLRPDGKAQVTIRYEDGQPREVHTVVVSTQHDPEVTNAEIHHTVRERVIDEVIPAELRSRELVVHINPTGRFVTGGPQGDCGLTGRKIIVDTYGGIGHHGGGAFSGKDATKVDRSASYMARYIAKNLVSAGLADRVEVQLAYAIGVAEPVSVHVDSFGTSVCGDRRLEVLVREHFRLTPRGIIESLDLRRPIFGKTAAYGHFGRADADFTWERTDLAAALRGAVAA